MPRFSPSDPHEPSFVSRQVVEAHRYYLNLNPPQEAALVVVCGGVERMRPDYIVKRESFPFLAIELVVEGSGSLILNGRRQSLAPGTLFAYGPGIPHTIQTDAKRPMRKYYVDFSGREAAQLLKLTAIGAWKAASIAAAHEVVEIFESLAKEARDDNPAAQEICSALLRLLLIKIRQRALPISRSLPRSFSTYEKLRKHLEIHFLRIHTVDELARECHVSPMYISRLFKRFGQTGAYQFLLRLKMNRAAELLLEEGMLVKEAAAALGFPDPFQFSRAFKRVHGVAPMTLLNSRRA